MNQYLPEGFIYNTEENREYLSSTEKLKEAHREGRMLEGRVLVCDKDHNLMIDLKAAKGIILRDDAALGLDDGSTRDIAIISKVNKPVVFKIKETVQTGGGEKFYLTRKEVQRECVEEKIKRLEIGDIIPAKVTHIEAFGAFVDIGCGIISLIPIDMISVSRIEHPKQRFKIGENIRVIIKDRDSEGRIMLSHKELLGTWEQNAERFAVGQTVTGVIRSIESYGVFVELAPNLAGLAELCEGVKIGQSASVYIKNIIPEKMKIKLIIVDTFEDEAEKEPIEYFYFGDRIDSFLYTPECCPREIKTEF